jgi:hypothetical protein
MKKTLLGIISLFCTHHTWAQAVNEFKAIRFYEHHSSDVTNQPFSESANGSKSGYDFVNKQYYNSFNTNNMGAYLNGEEANIDMVEHNGPFGTNGASLNLGFTAGVSTIWDGDIKGNGTTKWHKVTGGVTTYNATTTYAQLKDLYDAGLANVAVAAVNKDDVYIGKIRNTNLFVLIKCTSVKLPKGAPDGTNDNIYFDFDYKHGSDIQMGIKDLTQTSFQLYPNPTNGKLFIQSEPNKLNTDITLWDITGKQIELTNLIFNNDKIELNISFLPAGLYTLRSRNSDNTITSSKFLKAD